MKNRLWQYARATELVALIIFLASQPVKSQPADGFKHRCLWVVRNALISEKTIDDVILFAAQNKFNHLIVQVRGRGDALYNSKLVPRSALVEQKEFDPLGYLIRRAHSLDIKVHAWVNVYLLWSASQLPYSKDHLLLKQPDWIDTQSTQPPDIQKAIRVFKNGSYNGNEGLYLAPHNPEVTQHLLAIFEELVTNYDLDGLHLDYVRFHDSDYGLNPGAVSAYKERTGVDIRSSLLMTQNRTDQNSTRLHLLEGWSDFRRRAVTDLVKQTGAMVRVARPGCILSAAVKPNLYDAKDRFFQEWDVWLAAGYIDWVIPMNYTASIRDFATNIEVIYDNLPLKYRDRIIMGVATYNQSSQDAADKIKYARITHFQGISLFSYNVLEKNPRYFDPLRKEMNGFGD